MNKPRQPAQCFASLGVLVFMVVTGAVLFAVAQRLSIEADTIASERAHMHRIQAAQSAYAAAVQSIRDNAQLPNTVAQLATLRANVNTPAMATHNTSPPCLADAANGLCVGLSTPLIGDDWPAQWWTSPPHRSAMLEVAARLNLSASPGLPHDHPLQLVRYWIRPFEQVDSEQLAWQIIVLVPANSAMGSDTVWTLWLKAPPSE